MSPRPAVTATLDPAGLRELQRAMDVAKDKALAGVAAGITIAAEAIAALERAAVPVDTGALRDGVKVRYAADGQSAQVGVSDLDLYYAIFIEWGTTLRPAVPYATPAAERGRVEFPRAVITEVRRRVG